MKKEATITAPSLNVRKKTHKKVKELQLTECTNALWVLIIRI